MDTCAGCSRQIDPAFDSTIKDARGRAWHAACMIEKAGANDTAAIADGEGAIHGSLLGWALGRWDRRKVRKRP